VEFALAFLKDDEDGNGTEEVPAWIRSAPDNPYYDRKPNG
jgi:hypothetical protein